MTMLRIILAIAILQVPVIALFHKDVTPDTFDTLLDPMKSHLLIEFYAPWCGHCKNLAPEYERLGVAFAESEDVVIAQVDADKHKKLAKRFDVKGYPTLKWVQKGSTFEDAEEPSSERTAESLLQYVNTKTGMSKKLKDDSSTSVMKISDVEFKALTADEDVHAFIGFFAPWCGHCKALKPAWEELGKLFEDEADVTIGSVDCDANSGLCSSEGVSGYPTLKYYSHGDSEKFEGGRKIEDLVTFVNSKTGLDIAPDGGVLETGGTIAELSHHIKNYLAAASDVDRSDIVNKCKEVVDKLDSKARKNYDYYTKVFANIAQKGVNYVKEEKDRLLSILRSSESLKAAQRRNFMRRLNVLNLFDTQGKSWKDEL